MGLTGDYKDNIFLVVGPPGTGKTTHLGEKVKEAVSKYGSQAVLVSSLTKAAAYEIVGRGLPVPRKRIGTLHSHAYQALGGGIKIAESDKDTVADFNRRWKTQRRGGAGYPLTKRTVNVDDLGREGDSVRDHKLGMARLSEIVRQADWQFERYTLARARCTPEDEWDPSLREFARHWEAAKLEQDSRDFEDLIHLATSDVDRAPGNPWLIYGDEAQDWSQSEMRLLRQWGAHAKAVILVGDPDQTIYAWRGADPSEMYRVKPEHVRVLDQSYRVSRAVRALSQTVLDAISERKHYEYRATERKGRILRMGNFTFRAPDEMVAHAERTYLSRGKSVMFLATCGYMVGNLVACVKARGLPLGNPYRIKRGDWNPMRGLARVCDFLRLDPQSYDDPRPWTWEELWSWIQMLPVDNERALLRGTKAAIEKLAKDEKQRKIQCADSYEGAMATLENMFPAAATVWNPDDPLSSLSRLVTPRWRKQLDYACAIARRSGRQNIPKFSLIDDDSGNGKGTERSFPICVGTIHSVKGGEADAVYLSPELSRAAQTEWMRLGTSRDAVLRTIYVGMTRAREDVILCGSGLLWSFLVPRAVDRGDVFV